ncbi:hypothetical protein [Aeromonas salmonicida]|uniref:hypothetical protein n=1 Tax=Aeromonas salmonicida TaxID=645 RepID=UPI0039A4FBCE
MAQSSSIEILLSLGRSVFIAFIGWALSSTKSASKAVDADETWAKMPASGKYTLNFYRQYENHHKTVEVYGSRSDVESEIFRFSNGLELMNSIWFSVQAMALTTEGHTTTTEGQTKARTWVVAW